MTALTHSLTLCCSLLSLGHLDAAGSAFDWSAFERSMLAYTPDIATDWFLGDKEQQILLEGCLRSSDARLSTRQRAVFSYACWQWTMACECDDYQELRGRMDEAGKWRNIRLLSGHCPVSPQLCLDGFGKVAGRTWTECSEGVYEGNNDVDRRYASEKTRIACLLQDFVNEYGYMDGPRMLATNDAKNTNMFRHNRLARIFGGCTMFPESGNYMTKPPQLYFKTNYTMTALLHCWSTGGTLGCGYQDANRLALEFPESCTVSV